MHGQGHRREHEHDGTPGCGLGKKRGRTARTERGLAARSAEGSCQIRRLAALQHDDNDQKSADDHVQGDQHKVHFPAERQQA